MKLGLNIIIKNKKSPIEIDITTKGINDYILKEIN